MGLFVVSYDLIKQKDYQPLWDELKRMGGHKPVESVYFLNLVTDSATAVATHLRQFIDSDDFLVVVKFTEPPAFARAKAGTRAWIEANC